MVKDPRPDLVKALSPLSKHEQQTLEKRFGLTSTWPANEYGSTSAQLSSSSDYLTFNNNNVCFNHTPATYTNAAVTLTNSGGK